MSFTSVAQIDRSKRPEAGPAPELKFGEYHLYQLDNGLKVIVVEDHKLPRLTMNLIIDRDAIFEGDKAGYVQLAGDMMRQGTVTRPKDQLDEEIDFMGADLSTSSTSVFSRGLSKYNEKLFELMADVTLNPAFPQEEFDKLQKQTISGIESAKDNPNAIAGKVFNISLYGPTHPYGESATIETVNKISVDDTKTYYQKYWKPNNAYLAIVGDIKPKDAEKLAKKYFGKWKKGEVVKNNFNAPAQPKGLNISFVNKENSVQSVLLMGNTIDLKPGAPDEVKLRLANQILGVGSLGRLFQNIREDKAYTYGAYSDYDTDKLIANFSASASVRNEVTDSAITEFLNEFERLQTEAVSEEELQGAKNAIIGSVGRSLENPQTLATYALNIQRYNLPEDYYETYLTRLQAVSAEDVMNVARQYIKDDKLTITVVGKASEVLADLEGMGTITFYDVEGKKTAKPEMNMPAPEGITAATVIDNYLKAIGGKENLAKVSDIKTEMGVTVSGIPVALKGVEYKKKPGYFKSELTAEAMGALEVKTLNGDKGRISGMQGAKVLEGEELEELKLEAHIFPEMRFNELGYKSEVKGMGKVDDKNAYILEITSPTGEIKTDYFGVESGLRLKSESTVEGPQGPMSTSTHYSDYREVKGVKYPYTIVSEVGPQKINLQVESIMVNEGIDNTIFTIE